VSEPAWRAKPSWFIVASNDRMISPDQEKMSAEKMKATTTTLSTSHVAMLAQPQKVAAFIAGAAGKTMASKGE
jgi:pimeloyl-ACP methyl ester carboxylesterase